MDEANERAWAALCHLGVLAGGLLPAGNFLVPGAIWAWFRRRSNVIDAAGRESLNFQLSVTLYAIPAIMVAMLLPARLRWLGYSLWCGVFLFAVVNVIRAGMAAQNGRPFRYPLTLRPIPPLS